ncbi:sugar ABC transporter ATP-binding protein [Agromyces tardus]|uniref:Sugar ABC transporter ATP-binding protein n=1 Tax=Agromyces tardus TaxID=2583849 RepID=A0A3M8AM13_9MICO|nr:sugar ABC transporter ATP-binding protein [Agromyces tardus]RNB52242.1 sugar ABC transporter ATP-binding protein [Agromyces tardus]
MVHDADGFRTVLAVRELSKTFTGQLALDRVALDVRAGEVHALIGENGSGKSTLIKCLAGFYEPDEGAAVELDGHELAMPLTTTQSARLGMVFVHQDLGLVPTLSVAENFAIGRGYETGILARVPWRRIRAHARAELTKLGCGDVDVDLPIWRLPIATQTIVAIARALSSAEEGAQILVLDEPTAALPDAEAELLFAAVREVTAQGVGVVYVSHKLDEIIRLADRITVLRDGRKIETVDGAGLTEKDLIRLIVGRAVDVSERRPREVGSRTRVSVRGLAANALRDVSFDLHEGEIVGLAGMLGSGRSELARILFGAQRRRAGTVEIDGVPARLDSPAAAMRRGVALIPENRRRDGGVLDQSLAVNMTLPTLRSFTRYGRISGRKERRRVDELTRAYGVRPPMTSRAFKYFSGGNQQKIVIAKWMNTNPRLVIFDEPVQGVDIGARAEIVEHVRAAAATGTAVLVISSEIDLMLGICDRVLVLREGAIIADLVNRDLDRAAISELVYFGHPELIAPSDSKEGDRS